MPLGGRVLTTPPQAAGLTKMGALSSNASAASSSGIVIGATTTIGLLRQRRMAVYIELLFLAA